VQLNGYYGDSRLPSPVAKISEEAKRLLKYRDRGAAIEKCAGQRLFDVLGTVERHDATIFIVREFVGHGIGTQMHEEPQVPNYVDRRNENRG